MVSQILRSSTEEQGFQSDSQTLLRIRHTCAHVLAMAVQTLFPETKVTIGPWTDTGFYYDFDRKLGQDLDLFSIQEDAGGGLIFWHPKGARMRLLIEDYWRKAHLDAGYELLYTPHIANLDLWKTSGHFDFYRENMFDQMEIEAQQYQLKCTNPPIRRTRSINAIRTSGKNAASNYEQTTNLRQKEGCKSLLRQQFLSLVNDQSPGIRLAAIARSLFIKETVWAIGLMCIHLSFIRLTVGSKEVKE